MENASGHWYPIASSREVGKRPLSLTRFGEQLVIWRTRNGSVAVMRDRCPHRGAALSHGQVTNDALVCPFHGLAFAANGQCVSVPVEADPQLAHDICAETLTSREENDYIWLWRSRALSPAQSVPSHPDLEGLRYGESVTTWPAHFTRCIENVCDYSHLPFVHKTTIGLFKRDTTTVVEMEDMQGGFRAHLIKKGQRKQCLEFLYPNLWMLKVSGGMIMSAVFTPIDESSTRVYGRTWYKSSLPGLRLFMDAYTRFSQFLVFREDWPIVASQNPGNVDDVWDEKLLPSDAPVIAYRKLRRKAAQQAHTSEENRNA